MSTTRFKAAPRNMGDLYKNYGAATRGAVAAAFKAIGTKTKAKLVARTAVNKIYFRGKFARGWYSRFEPGAIPLLRIGNAAPYSLFVELGRRPGRRPPPSSVLIPWIQAKLVLRPGQSAASVAFAVARGISKKGIKARPVLTSPQVQFDVMQTTSDEMEKSFGAALLGAAAKVPRP